MFYSLKFAISLISITAIISLPAYSDDYIGIKAGLNYSTSSASCTGYKQRASAGWFYNRKLSYRKGTALQLDFLYSQNGSKMGELFYRQDMDESYVRDSWTAYREYLQLSIILKKDFIHSIQYNVNILAGLSSGYLINATDKYYNNTYSVISTLETQVYYNEFDYGFLLGANFEYLFNNYLIMLEARYYIGLGDIYKSSGDSARNRCASISLGLGTEL